MEKSKETKQYTCIKSVKAEPCDLSTAQTALGRKFYKDDCDNRWATSLNMKTAI